MSEGLGGIAHSRPFHQTSLYVGYKNEGSVLRVLRLCIIRHLRLCTMAFERRGTGGRLVLRRAHSSNFLQFALLL